MKTVNVIFWVTTGVKTLSVRKYFNDLIFCLQKLTHVQTIPVTPVKCVLSIAWTTQDIDVKVSLDFYFSANVNMHTQALFTLLPSQVIEINVLVPGQGCGLPPIKPLIPSPLARIIGQWLPLSFTFETNFSQTVTEPTLLIKHSRWNKFQLRIYVNLQY